MIDIKVRYQAVAFMPSIEASSDNISQMMGLFADKGLIPTTYSEVSPITPIPQLRFTLQSTNNEWNLNFGFDRIAITKNMTDAKGNNLGTIEQFCADASGFFTQILSKHSQQANRLALSSDIILKEMPESMLYDIYTKLFNPIPLHADNKPVEWSSMTVSRMQKQVCSTNEDFNFISTIRRRNGLINQNPPIPLITIDRISINIDINTIPNNTKNRFGENEIVKFYKNNIYVWHNDLLSEILEKIR
ncbi:MAG: hypothetical protein MdMp024_1836 [Bacteroidales bacterium]